jgi:hypothetical protein
MTPLLFLLAGMILAVPGGATLESTRASNDWAPLADPQAAQWTGVRGGQATLDFFGKPVPLAPTEIRSRWTSGNLHLLFICPYKALYLKPGPVTGEESNKLWDWDVAEAFIGRDFEHIGRYKEFQVSPQNEFVDLDINREDPKAALGVAWQSGFKVKARVDAEKKIWYGEMSILFASLGLENPKTGDEFRIGLYRIEGPEPNRIYVAWQPTGKKTFHEPAAFGRLVLK